MTPNRAATIRCAGCGIPKRTDAFPIGVFDRAERDRICNVCLDTRTKEEHERRAATVLAPKVRKCSYCGEPLPRDAHPKVKVCDACVRVLMKPGAKVADAINRLKPAEPMEKIRRETKNPNQSYPYEAAKAQREKERVAARLLPDIARRVDHREAADGVVWCQVPVYVIQERAARLRMKHFGPALERRKAEQADADAYIVGGKP